MADGVGVTGGGSDGLSLTIFRLLLGSGVVGGGGMNSVSPAAVSPLGADESAATSPGPLLFRGRFLKGTTGPSATTFVELRADRRSAIIYGRLVNGPRPRQ